jgi:hypothetical protein
MPPKGDACVFGSDDQEAPITALKRRIANLQAENLRYRDLMGVLSSRTELEAFEIHQNAGHGSVTPRNHLSMV